jgi:ABC-2 type transport system permease protein
MWSIIKRTINDRKTVILIYIIVALAFLLMYVSMFPSFADQTEQWDEVMKTIPEGVMKAFNLEDYSFARLENFLSGELYSITWPLLLIILAVSTAGAAIANEIEKGTIEIILAQPITRTKFYLSRYIAGVVVILVFVIITIYPTIPMAKIFDISITPNNYSTLAFSAFLFGIAVFSVGYALSAIFSDRGKVYFLTAGLMVLMYVFNIVALLKESFSDLKYLSFFHYFNPVDNLVRNKIDATGVIVFITTIIVAFAVGLIVYNKRDIAT